MCREVTQGVNERGTADPAAEVPQPRPGVDLRSLAITPEDAFVFSRIDGRTSVKEIQLTTGLPEDRVLSALHTLARVGAIEPLELAQASEVVIASPVQFAAGAKGAAAEDATGAWNRPAVPEMLPADAPLEQRLDVMLKRLDELDYYQLLQVPRNADKKVIKNAYFRQVTDFHPDKYYGKELGETKAKLELVFQRLTLAQETLSRSKRREAYDATLGPEQPLEPPSPQTATDRVGSPPTSGAEASGGTPRRDVSPSPSGGKPVRNRAPQPPPAVSTPPPTKRSPGVGNAPAPPPTHADGKGDNPLRKQRARASVARRFAAMSGARSQKSLVPPSTVEHSVRVPLPPGVSSQSMARTMASGSSQSLSRALTHAPASNATAVSGQLRRYVQTAERELQADNPLAAANALRLALSLDPNDRELRIRLEEVELTADRKLATENLNQAKARERSGDYQAAGRLYAKAARGRQSGELYALAAQCYRRDEAGLRAACEHARKAVELDRDNPALHLLLADIYVEARMPQSAIKVLESALSLQPPDDAIQKLLSRLKRGE